MVNSYFSALGFLTILPVGRWVRLSETPGKMFSFFPLVGLIVGVIVALMASIRFLPRELSAFIALVAWVGLTGGLHLDGLADSCDALLATVSLERRLEIMKDPRAGSFAVIGVVLVLLGKWTAINTVSPAVLIVPPIMGRWSMVLAVAAFPNARTSGMAARFRVGFGKTPLVVACLMATFLVLLMSFVFGWRLLIALLVAPFSTLIIGAWASRRLGGGLTGDVYGAICEVVELLCLICLSIN